MARWQLDRGTTFRKVVASARSQRSFYEDQFPFASTATPATVATPTPPFPVFSDDPHLDDPSTLIPAASSLDLDALPTTEAAAMPSTEVAASSTSSTTSSSASGEDSSSSRAASATPATVAGGPDSVVINPPPPIMGRGQRIKLPSTRLRDHVLSTSTSPSPSTSSPSPTPSSSSTPYSLANYVNCDSFSIRHRHFLAAVTSGVEPTSFKQALRDDNWCQAMSEEISALEKNGTWDLTTLPPGKKALGCRWVYKLKYKSDGSIERHKARLVVFGNRQIEGIDYGETFAPVVKMVTIRAFLAVAAAKNWALHQMDVHNAFLHGDLHEEVYMKLPPGFNNGHEGKVCRLRKSLYGLKQAPRCWFAKLATALKDYGFTQSYSDYSLFSYVRGDTRLHILIYVDDLVIAGTDDRAISDFKSYLGSCFHMKDLGPLKYFLGIEVARSRRGLFLSQRKYALDIISEVGLLGAKPAAFPIEQNHRLALATGPVLADVEPYRRLIGRLVYLSVTRLDLAYVVHILSQFLQHPRQEHYDAALRVVRYLKGRPGQGILLRSDSTLTLQAWCDSDWAGCPLTRCSVTGWFVSLGGSPVSWKTKKQPTVSRSSAEAEYRSMAAITCELKWLTGLLLTLGVPVSSPVELFCDNQSALYIAHNPVFHERTKHIEIDCHFVRDAIRDALIRPVHVASHDQLADCFTKALGQHRFDTLIHKLGILNLHAPT